MTVHDFDFNLNLNDIDQEDLLYVQITDGELAKTIRDNRKEDLEPLMVTGVTDFRKIDTNDPPDGLIDTIVANITLQ